MVVARWANSRLYASTLKSHVGTFQNTLYWFDADHSHNILHHIPRGQHREDLAVDPIHQTERKESFRE